MKFCNYFTTCSCNYLKSELFTRLGRGHIPQAMPVRLPSHTMIHSGWETGVHYGDMTPGMLATVSHTEESGDEISIEAKVKRYWVEMVLKRKEREREWRET